MNLCQNSIVFTSIFQAKNSFFAVASVKVVKAKKRNLQGRRVRHARVRKPTPFVTPCVRLDGICCLSLLWGALQIVDVLFCKVRMSKMIVPKEKSAVFWRFLSLCPQFDPYLLGSCDGGGAVHKKVAPKLGEFRCDRMKVCTWCTKWACRGLSHLFELLHLREDKEEWE